MSILPHQFTNHEYYRKVEKNKIIEKYAPPLKKKSDFTAVCKVVGALVSIRIVDQDVPVLVLHKDKGSSKFTL
jgi:hypothetical protein